MTINKPQNIGVYSLCLFFIIVFLISACGGDDGEASVTGNTQSNTANETVNEPEENDESLADGTDIFLAVKSVDQSNRSGFYSNEIEAVFVEGESLTFTWTEPTRKSSGNCIESNDLPLSYTFGIGLSGGNYQGINADELSNYGDLECGLLSNSNDENCNTSITRCRLILTSIPEL